MSADSRASRHVLSMFKAVRGIIVIEDFPPIVEYRGVKVIGLQDVPTL